MINEFTYKVEHAKPLWLRFVCNGADSFRIFKVQLYIYMASHGITRTPYSRETRTAALREEELQKINEYNSLVTQVQGARSQKDYNDATLTLTSALLKRNPEFYTVWNYRREILLNGILPPATAPKPAPDSEEEKSILLILKGELIHLLPLLKSHPKCYALWNHRLWVLSQSSIYLSPEKSQQLWKEELGLVGMMLGRDERNFHGWAYRRIVVGAMEKELIGKGMSLVEQEFEYTTVMIKSNMSNYSAWHSRTKLVGRLLKERGAKKQERMDFLEDEINLLKKAIITKPQDQSLWFYHRWLIHSNASPSTGNLNEVITPNMPHSIKIALVSSEIEDLTDMLGMGGTDASKKWLLAALVGLVGLLRRLRSCKPARGAKPVVSDDSEEEEEDEEEEGGDVDKQAEMKRVWEWVKRLIAVEGEKGKGRRWIDLATNAKIIEKQLKDEGW
ncbi:hypothetical protein EV426DRAFT_640040 [Tirmania nivea]|nr:hypothetical protein EV426DRAFT_640040 [Tirmania nivea]